MRKIDERRTALCDRVEAWALRLTVRTPKIRIQQMSRKWGSCSTSGTLTLAYDLAEREAEFQDFVIAHELLHLRGSEPRQALQGAHDSARTRLERARHSEVEARTRCSL